MMKTNVVTVGNITFGPGIPKICVPIVGENEGDIIEQAKAAVAAAPDVIEWRADKYSHVLDGKSVLQMLKTLSDILGQIPLLFTFRSEREGGNRPISTVDYVNLNRDVSDSGLAALQDVEVSMDTERMQELIVYIHEKGGTVIGSHHRFDRTPCRTDMLRALVRMEESGADILKLAVMPHSQGDVNRLLQTICEATSNLVHQPVIAMSMGSLGASSRIAGEIYGSCMTFGAVMEASAPGQMPVESLRKEMESLHKIVEKISNE